MRRGHPRERRGHRDGACRGVAGSDGHSGSLVVGVAGSDGRWRSLAGPDVAREPRPRRPDAASDEWWWGRRVMRCEAPRSASAASPSGCAPSWVHWTPQWRAPEQPAPVRGSPRRGPVRVLRPPVRGPLLPVRARSPVSRRPCPCPWPSTALRAVLHDGGHRRLHDDEYGQPGRPQSRQRGSMHQCLTSEPARATPCSLARAPLRARVPGSSSAPKRSLTSVPAMAGTVPYSFTTTADLAPWANFTHAASAASSNRVRSAFCA